MIRLKTCAALVAGAVSVTALASTAPAFGQKAKDTFRVAFLESTQNADAYTDSKPENNFLGHALFDSLVEFDSFNAKLAPLLAESWKQIDPTTLEFTLRDDISWHDGEAFDADDVVYLIDWLTDEKTKLRFKRNWSWIDRAEKVGPHTVRIVSKRPTPYALAQLANTNIYPEHVHAPLERKADFGSAPVGTGMYRATQVDRNQGVVMVKNDAYKHGGEAKPASNVGRVEVIPISDTSTQIAEMLAGNIHAIRALTFEQAESLDKDERFTFTLGQSISYIYMYYDVAGRSGLDMFKDKRVREALSMAINRDVIPSVRAGSRTLPRGNPTSLCWELQKGCAFSAKLPPYDPPRAKQLLAEAGYPDGFDVELTAFGSVKDFAEAIAGQLREIGVRATVNAVTFTAYRKQQRDGQIQINANAWSAGGIADIARTVTFYFSPGPRDYVRDEGLHALAKKVNAEMDDAKRRQLAQQLFDTVVNERYIVPVSGLPLPIVHTSEATVRSPRIEAYGFFMSDVNWK